MPDKTPSVKRAPVRCLECSVKLDAGDDRWCWRCRRWIMADQPRDNAS